MLNQRLTHVIFCKYLFVLLFHCFNLSGLFSFILILEEDFHSPQLKIAFRANHDKLEKSNQRNPT